MIGTDKQEALRHDGWWHWLTLPDSASDTLQEGAAESVARGDAFTPATRCGGCLGGRTPLSQRWAKGQE
jgi:hypothetical protein